MGTSLLRPALGCLALLTAFNGVIGGENNPGTGAGGSGPPPSALCSKSIMSGRAPLRRLTRFEYNNTAQDLLGDTTSPGSMLPAEEIGNGFGNDADQLSVSSLLAQEYDSIAEAMAGRATASPAMLGKLAPCGSSVTASTESTCARSIIEAFVPRAYRRPLVAGESDDVYALYTTLRAQNPFATAVAGVLEAVLQSPDFLYRIEWGVPDPAGNSQNLLRPSGYEMATRLSYLYWSTTPDDTLWAAAGTGQLLTKDGVMAQATRLLNDQRSHAVVAFFFDSLLPINGLTDLARDATVYPNFTATIGSLMHQETQRFLEYVIYEGAGDWVTALTAPFTFVNKDLAAYYGMSGVTSSTFQMVPTDPTKRVGFLTQGALMTGSTPSNNTNPVIRGNFVQGKLLCHLIPLPTGDILAQVKPPDPYSANTARERYTIHSQNPVCHTCHSQMDPIGFALENFDPVGTWRDTENGETIDASGSVPGVDDQPVNGPVALVQKIASADTAKTCFADHWIEFGYGRTLDDSDMCTKANLEDAFKKSGYNVKQLLLALSQTDSFLYLPPAQ